MPRTIIKLALLAMPWLLAATAGAQIHQFSDELRREALDREASIKRMLMVPMRDCKRLATRVYIPRATLEEDLEVSGPVEVVLYVSSNARDTDFTAKLVDVDPDSTAWNLDVTIQRARYREGYDREVFLEDGQVVELRLGPVATSNGFRAGNRDRLEVSSSNFPRFARNLNNGEKNSRATQAVVAINAAHHGDGYPSRIVLTSVPR